MIDQEVPYLGARADVVDAETGRTGVPDVVLVVGDDICPHAVWAIEHAAAGGRVALFFDHGEASAVAAQLRPPLWTEKVRDTKALVADFEMIVAECGLERRAVHSETTGSVLFHAYGGPDVLARVEAAEAACRAPRRRRSKR